MITTRPQPDAQILADVLSRRAQFNSIEKPTLGHLADSGLFSFAGRLGNPTGWWHCPACWMDYATKRQYTGAAA